MAGAALKRQGPSRAKRAPRRSRAGAACDRLARSKPAPTQVPPGASRASDRKRGRSSRCRRMLAHSAGGGARPRRGCLQMPPARCGRDADRPTPMRATTRASVAPSRFTRSSRAQRAPVAPAAARPRVAIDAGSSFRRGDAERPRPANGGRRGRARRRGAPFAYRPRRRRKPPSPPRRDPAPGGKPLVFCVRAHASSIPPWGAAGARRGDRRCARVDRDHPRQARATAPTPPFATRRRSPAASAAAEKVRALLRKSACAARNAAPLGGAADGRERALGTRWCALRRDARSAMHARAKKISMR